MEGMTRGELAKQTGVSMATIRYYEDSGILPPPARIANGYRVYSEDYVVKIRFIKDAQSLGYPLKQIKEILHDLNQGIGKYSLESGEEILKERVRDKIQEIDERIATLRSIQTLLSSLLEMPREEIHDYLQSFRNRE
ncbi:transcriptional regulator [Bacillus sp. FJAT-27264]|uniref:MerR family transcriptional regulator n=1 Tax=Paenibacillus sp. (strain DSM 101736 / FJAT-27264) TaxID=1850362 RepID=UPI000807E6A5|nr:MerR family transcriptional regulator [Bacillus sp. FJAT-27264]OBZ15713.1 transcriptional regulator [Bacillus sp. FJAT-27264]